MSELSESFTTKIKAHVRNKLKGELNKDAKTKAGFIFDDMYELIIYLWNRSNRKLSLKPIDYYMTDGDKKGRINDKWILFRE